MAQLFSLGSMAITPFNLGLFVDRIRAVFSVPVPLVSALSNFFSRRQFYLLIERRAPRMIAVFHIFMSVHELLPNQSPEPMRVIAGSSASRLDDFGSRMAQLFSLDSRAERLDLRRAF